MKCLNCGCEEWHVVYRVKTTFKVTKFKKEEQGHGNNTWTRHYVLHGDCPQEEEDWTYDPDPVVHCVHCMFPLGLLEIPFTTNVDEGNWNNLKDWEEK